MDDNKELQVQLPMSIDTKRYLIGKISFKDLLIIAPFALLSGFLTLVVFSIGLLNPVTAVLCFLPTLLGFVGQTTKHKVRKEITYFEYGIFWELDFKLRKKEFFLKKGAISEVDDSRSLFLKDTFAGCYETDTHFVKVLESSSINLSLMNKQEEKEVISSFRSFMNTLNFINQVQFLLLAAPISLENYILRIDKMNRKEENPIKRLLNEADMRAVDADVQKNRDLVTRKRYIIISQKIGRDREKSLSDIISKAQLLKQKLESLELGGGFERLNVNILDNDELTKLMFTCLDYDSSISVGDHIVSRARQDFGVSFGEETAKDIIENLSKGLFEKVN